MVGKMSARVPADVWEPIADRIAAEFLVTRNGMLYHGQARQFFVPRAKFWRELRDLPERYSLTAIASISGHHHTTVMSAFESENASTPLAEIKRPHRKTAALVGKIFGTLVVVAMTAARAANNTRIWLCHCAVCKNNCEKSTAALGHGSECPACKRTKYRHRVERPQLHHKARARAYG
jgi:hypothetical protein